MPSPWSARLLSTGASNSSNNSHGAFASSRGAPREDQFTNIPYEPPPTLHHERPAQQTSARPHTSHGRSSSNTTPKFFSRKKSTHDFHDTDVPFDDDLVPVLDEASKTDRTPGRVFGGKKSKQDDEGNKVSRRCMCCDNKVSVPKELEKFRCMACVTINDLKPVPQRKNNDKKADNPTNGSQPLRMVPLTLERTRTIIDRCLVAYLESRCQNSPDRRLNEAVSTSSPRNAGVQAPELVRGKHRVLSKSPPNGDAPHSPRSDSANHGGSAPGMIQRKPLPVPLPEHPNRKPPPPPLGSAARTPTQPLQPPNASLKPPPSPRTAQDTEYQRRYERAKVIFRPLEEYILATFGEYECLNNAFNTSRPSHEQLQAKSTGNLRAAAEPAPDEDTAANDVHGLSELDGKTLLLGELGENSTWWTGKLERLRSDKGKRKKVGEGSKRAVSSRSPNIEWSQLREWYEVVHSAGKEWRLWVSRVRSETPTISANLEGRQNAEEIESDLEEARQHAIRALLKVSENILKHPTRLLKEPDEVRFLLIILANPSLYPNPKGTSASFAQDFSRAKRPPGLMPPDPSKTTGRSSPGRSTDAKLKAGPQHTGILKRVFGLLANATDTCHRYLINWLARYEEDHFMDIVDLVASFVNHRLGRSSHSRHRSKSGLDDGGLIPDLSGSAMNTSAQLHSAMGLSGSIKKPGVSGEGETEWANDWQVKAAAKFMALLFTANNIWQGRMGADSKQNRTESTTPTHSPAAKARRSGQLLHTSSFYNTLLDYQDMITDFKMWEMRREKFAFCQYPLFLSMGTKIKILEYDARRQMENKAREAYFDQVIRQRAIDGYFHLRVRRECMVDDSLRQISEAVGSGQEELKKGLRVHFTGEEGVDAGGPRKEWFLMLVRDIFDPNHGMFVYDEESLACYFSPNSFETSDQFYLVGALLGLAIYNSTILDVALPSFAFRKLLAAAPSSTSNTSHLSSITGTKGQMTHTVADLAEFRPSLAAGLQQLLDFEGDVEETYCWTFVAPVERYGTVVNVPLMSNGEGTPVTNSNRHEFVDAYIRYLLDTSVTKQFEPFKRGFFTVCAGNALSLFRAEEIELLVRGSDEPLDVDSLQAVAVYENWRHAKPPHAIVPKPAETVPVIRWFWEVFAQASSEKQRKLLTFITGTDRIPAVGATSLILRIVAGGDGWSSGGPEEKSRLPVARTCFNMLVIRRYDSRAQLEHKLWMAVEESEGFGLK